MERLLRKRAGLKSVITRIAGEADQPRDARWAALKAVVVDDVSDTLTAVVREIVLTDPEQAAECNVYLAAVQAEATALKARLVDIMQAAALNPDAAAATSSRVTRSASNTDVFSSTGRGHDGRSASYTEGLAATQRHDPVPIRASLFGATRSAVKLETVDTAALSTQPTTDAADDIRPEDSVSNAGSSASRLPLDLLEEQQDLERRSLELEQQRLALKHRQELLSYRKSGSSVTRRSGVNPTSLLQPRSTKTSTVTPDRPAPAPARATLSASAPVFTPAVSNQASKDLVSALRYVTLPKTVLPTFNGDPLEYWPFVRAFEACVDYEGLNENVKLTQLLQCCSGRAKSAIECCSLSEDGYRIARNILHQRFGSSYHIVDAWIQRITAGPQLGAKDAVALQDFADKLRSCYECLCALGYLPEISTQRVLVKIVERLPQYLRARWLKTVQRLPDTPTIDDLMHFVAEAATEANHPVFGPLCVGKGVPAPAPRSSTSTQVNSASVANVRIRRCYACSGQCKSLFSCKNFKDCTVPERLKIAREHKLCFNCLRVGHNASNCSSERTCSIDSCGKRHCNLLHRQRVVKEETSDSSGAADASKDAEGPAATGCSVVTSEVKGEGMLPVVPVVVRSGGMEQVVNALLDTGSTATFCSSQIVQSLSLSEKPTSIALTTLDREERHTSTTIVQFEIAAVDSDRSHSIKAYTRTSIAAKPSNPHSLSLSHFEGIPFSHARAENVSVIIGQDYAHLFKPMEVRSGKDHEPYAVKTPLGWVINGTGANNGMESVNFVSTGSLERQVERFWRVEGWDSFADECALSVEDQKAVATWDDGTSLRENGHYQLPIPFKSERSLPSNRVLAEQRLRALKNKLAKNEDLRVRYTSFMDGLFQKGHAEPVIGPGPKGRTWYLPHHSVVNPRKPEKTRVVFDCAAQHAGVSLNSAVLSGPDLTNTLIGVLIRFRQHPVAIAADIEEMFHQVQVVPEHRDVLRFLWWPQGDLAQEPQEFRMTVHLFGGTWSPSCCCFALRKTATDNIGLFAEEAVTTVGKNFYMDDCLKSVEDEEAACALIQNLSQLLETGGFNLTKWSSSSKEVLASVPVEKRAKGMQQLDLTKDDLPGERVLGVGWHPTDDSLRFSLVLKQSPLTRRGILSTTSSLYDPLGLASPFLLIAKLLLQDLTQAKIPWDDPIPEDMVPRWQEWLQQLPVLSQMAIPRALKSRERAVSYHLHVFCDASQRAYGCVAFLVILYAGGNRVSNFVIAKSRLAPLKTMSIPRLELCAAVLAVRIADLLQKEFEFPLEETVFWSDSLIVIGYIRNESKRFHTFVANRISIIHRSSRPAQWHHVATAMNPADDVSRGLSAQALLASETWLHGPEFLLHPIGDDQAPVVIADDDPEVKSLVLAHVTEGAVEVEVGQDFINDFFSRFSSWISLRKRVAAWLKVKSWLKAKARNNQDDIVTDISVADLQEAEMEIYRHVQVEFGEWPDGPINVSRASPLFRLGVICENGILFVVGRHRKSLSAIPPGSKKQVLLPKQHHITSLIVRHRHAVVGHAGREATLAALRLSYWVIGARAVISAVISRCFLCRRWRAPAAEQQMADVPDSRAACGSAPFANTGIDVFGWFLVKQGRARVKRYGCVFTCLTMRAIHLEVLHSLDADSLINALIRFMARRGCPSHIFCDNGTNLVGAERELRKDLRAIDSKRVDAFLQTRDVQWHFNPPKASHMGGAWERMIRTVRKVLAPLLREQVLSDESLQTVLTMAEHLVNERPMTNVSTDPIDLNALTPNDLIRPPSSSFSLTGFENSARKRWKQVQHMADVFWKRWLSEYFPLLKARQKWVHPMVNLKINDIVLIVEDSRRGEWPLARILDVFPSSDGLVRKVKLKTSSSVLVRPITKLCLLEGAESSA